MTNLFLSEEGDLVYADGESFTTEPLAFKDEIDSNSNHDAVFLANEWLDTGVNDYECIGYLADFVKEEDSEAFRDELHNLETECRRFEVVLKYDGIEKMNKEAYELILGAIHDLHQTIKDQEDRIIPNGKEN